MARDYLDVPTTGISVERTFSKLRHICTDLGMSPNAETVTEAVKNILIGVVYMMQMNPLGTNASTVKLATPNTVYSWVGLIEPR